jgi:hypothetical protein
MLGIQSLSEASDMACSRGEALSQHEGYPKILQLIIIFPTMFPTKIAMNRKNTSP